MNLSFIIERNAMKMLARRTALLSLLIFSVLPAFANQRSACVSDLDNQIGTLYLCGYGGKFKVLSLENCDLQDSDMPAVVDYLKNHPRINALDLSENNLTGKSMQMLSVIQTLAWMSASYNQVGDKGAIAIANMKSLTNLDLIASNVGDAGAKALAALSLQALDLSRNQIHDDGVMALANNKSLIILSLDSNKISDAGA